VDRISSFENWKLPLKELKLNTFKKGYFKIELATKIDYFNLAMALRQWSFLFILRFSKLYDFDIEDNRFYDKNLNHLAVSTFFSFQNLLIYKYGQY